MQHSVLFIVDFMSLSYHCILSGVLLGKPLHIGSYVHCMVNAEDKVEVIMGESRTVQVTINPRQTFRAEVRKGYVVYLA